MANTQPSDEESRELAVLLEAIASGAIEDLDALEPAELALLRAHLSEEELERLFDRTAGVERD